MKSLNRLHCTFLLFFLLHIPVSPWLAYVVIMPLTFLIIPYRPPGQGSGRRHAVTLYFVRGSYRRTYNFTTPCTDRRDLHGSISPPIAIDWNKNTSYPIDRSIDIHHDGLHLGSRDLPRPRRSLPPPLAQHSRPRTVVHQELLQIFLHPRHCPDCGRYVSLLRRTVTVHLAHHQPRNTASVLFPLRHARSKGRTPQPLETHAQQSHRPAIRSARPRRRLRCRGKGG